MIHCPNIKTDRQTLSCPMAIIFTTGAARKRDLCNNNKQKKKIPIIGSLVQKLLVDTQK